jgi:hypothetical protein
VDHTEIQQVSETIDQDEISERILTEMHSIIVQVMMERVGYELVVVLRETITMGLNQEPMLMYLIQENINDTDNMFFNL